MINPQGNVLFGDFGAASNLNQFSPERRVLMQAIEVRAFGYMIEDMLNLIEHPHSPKAQALHQLVQDCLQPNLSARPSFNDLKQQLASMA